MEVKPGYKQTEVGIIPFDWDVVSVGSLASFTSGVGINVSSLSGETTDTPVPVFGGNGIAGFTKQSLVREPTVIVGRVGQRCGEVYLSPGPAWITDNALYPRVKHREFDVRFLALALRSARLNDVKNRNDLPLVTQSILHSMRVAWPTDTEEQGAIVAALGDVDLLLGALDRLISKKRDLKQAAMQQLLTGRTRLPGFNGEWLMARLGETAILKARIGWQGLTTAEYLETGDYYLVTGTDFKNGYIDWNECCFVDESRYKQDKYIQLKLHDVIVTKDGTIGKVALISDLPKPATLNSGVFVIRPKHDAFHPEFLYYLLCSKVFADFLGQLSAGSTISHLYQKDFVSFVYTLPATIEEQMAIATMLSDMDAELSLLIAKRDKTRALKQAMMQELLTGKTRLVPTGDTACLKSPVPNGARKTA